VFFFVPMKLLKMRKGLGIRLSAEATDKIVRAREDFIHFIQSNYAKGANKHLKVRYVDSAQAGYDILEVRGIREITEKIISEWKLFRTDCLIWIMCDRGESGDLLIKLDLPWPKFDWWIGLRILEFLILCVWLIFALWKILGWVVAADFHGPRSFDLPRTFL